MNLYLRQVATLFWKDVLVELRSREILSSVGLFCLLLLIVFSFAFNPLEKDLRPVFPGILWTAFYFAGTLGMGRAFLPERAGEAFSGLLLSPVDRGAIFLSKFLSTFTFMLLAEVVLTPVFFALTRTPFTASPGAFLLALLLGTAGFASTGTFLSASLSALRAGELLLTVLLFPLLAPAVIGAVRLTEALLAGEAETASLWFKALGAYDIIFLVVPWVLFDHLTQEV
jgi:heme exporter protein B